MRIFNGLIPALGSALALGLASTFGDWVWKVALTDGSVVAAVGHGLLFFGLLATLLTASAQTPGAWRRLHGTLALVGLALAGAFYPLASLVGYRPALLVSWTAMWLSLALMQRWAERERGPLAIAVLRGLIAALGSGAAFAAVVGMLWGRQQTDDWLLRAALWSGAFAPGMLALLIARPSDQESV